MTTTIGSQTNVPDPGSPITSPWAQDTARKIVHTFANVAARDAWSTRPDGAMCVTTDTDTLWLWNGTAWSAVARQSDLDARYVNVDGDTMSGNLVVSSGAGPNVTLQTAGRIESLCNLVAQGNLSVDRTLSTAIVVGQPYVGFNRSGTTIGNITIASATSVAYNTTSDERTKQVDEPVTDAAARAARIGGGVFRGRYLDDDGQPAGETWDLLFAHDLDGECPYAVTGERGAVVPVDDPYGRTAGDPVYQQVNMSALVPLLFAAVAELVDRVETLESAGHGL
jgi:hypothetical protein